MSRYLVTGATGFLGGHLVERLRGAGHEVVALGRGNDEARLRDLGATVRRGDVLDSASVADAAAGCEGVFHCAGKVSRKAEDAADLFRVHVDGTRTTLEACRKAGVRRAVVASTSGVVAVSKEARVRAESAEAPTDLIGRWPYYRSKLYAEQAAFEQSRDGLEVVAVSPSLLLGPGDTRGSSTGDVVKFLDRKVPMVPAGGLSFVDVRDAAEAMALAMDRGRAGQRYLVGGANMTVAAFFQRLERISGVPAPRLGAPRGMGLARFGADVMERVARRLDREPPVDRISVEMAQCFWYVDSSKAKRELGWEPRDPSDTLADTVRDLYARGVVWPRAAS
ncbi:MAG: NAD-dependent epimerase/dehydratase family protein [Polyangiaceae bacterium]